MNARWLSVIILVLATPAVAGAQSYNSPETGEKALGTYFATDIDSVSLTNGNLHLHIPIFSLSGRQVPATLALDYDSNAYELRTWNNGNGTYTFSYEFMQWKKSSSLQMGRLNSPSRGIIWVGSTYIQWSVTIPWGPPNGSRYAFSTVITQSCTTTYNGTCNGTQSPPDGTFYDNLTLETTDSEFVQLKTGTYFSGGSTPAYITFKDGSRFQVPATGSTPTVITTNGNFLTPNTNSQGTANYGTTLGDYVPLSDTVGRSIGYQKSGLTETVTLTDANGQSQVYQIVWKTVHAYNQKESSQITLDQDMTVVDYVQLPNGKRYTLTYNSEGMVSKVTLPSGAYIRYEYGHPVCGRGYVLRRYVSADGTSASENQTNYSYTFQTPPGSAVYCVNANYYDLSSGAVLNTTVTDPAGNKVQHIFTTANHLETTMITTTSTNQILKRVDRVWGGLNPHIDTETTTMPDVVRKTQYTYDSYNNVTRQEDFDWGTQVPGARLRYVDKTYLSSACTSNHVCNRVATEKIYTDAGTLVAETDYEYDNYSGSNALVSRSGSIPGWTSPSGVRGNVTAVKQWLDKQWTDSQGIWQLSQTAAWLITTNQYDVLGNKVKMTDPGGHATNIDFTDHFSVLNATTQSYVAYTPPNPTYAYAKRVTEPSGFYVDLTSEFNTGLITESKDSSNRTTTKTYDAINREVQENYPNGGFTTFCYNDPTPSAACYDSTGPSARKQVKVDTSGNLGTMIVHYDLLYRETKKETYDPEGTIYVETVYDANGRKWKVSNPRRSAENAVWTQFTYDALGRPILTTAPDNSTVQYAYSGNKTTVTDEAGNQRRYTYDGLGLMTKVEEPNPSLANPIVTLYSYNVLGKLIQSNQSNLVRTWDFDSLGRTLTETLPESGATKFEYTADSFVAKKLDARSIATTFTYHSTRVHQVGSKSYSDGTPTVSFNYNTQGLRTSMTDALGSVTYTYDSNTDKLTQESRTLTGVTGTFTANYGYNIKGDLTQITYPSGRVVTHIYNTGGGCCNSKLLSVVDGTTNTTVMSGLSFNAAGELLTNTLGNGLSQNYGYDPNRVQQTSITASISGTTLMNFTYNYGTATTNTGRVLSRTDAIQTEHSMVYSYDSIYRLSQAVSKDSSWDIAWDFDVWGNRTTQTPRGFATSKVGTQTSGYSNNRNTTYTYDSSGNQTNDGLHNYTFNADNQITQMDGTAAIYVYDGEGHRMKKTVGTETTYYFYGAGGLLCEFSTSNTISSATVASNTDKTMYRTSDKLGSALLGINSAGLVIENNRTLPYGEMWQAEPTPMTNDKKFTTYQRDQESGLDYAGGRYFAVTAGRFTSVDPGDFGESTPQSFNRYIYVMNDPINHHDPNGKECIDEWVGGTLKVKCYYTAPMSFAPLHSTTMFSTLYYDDLRGVEVSSAEMAAQRQRNNARDLRNVKEGFNEALDRLTNPNCAQLFNITGDGVAPMVLLRQLMDQGHVGVGPIAPVGGAVANATTEPVTYNDGEHTFEGVQITFDNSRSSSSLYGGKDAVAKTLLHELGHAYEKLTNAGYNVGTSSLVPDGPVSDPMYPQRSRDNAAMIQKNCF